MTAPLCAPETHKAAPPLDTVRRVRELLANLDVFTVETFHPPAARGAAYSCRLELGDAPFLGAGFSVNGKGMSPRWALASAYGELMERLGCGELLPRTCSAADAQCIPVGEFARGCPEAFLCAMGATSRAEMADFLRDAFGGFLRCAPFEEVGSGEKVLLPEEMIRDLCGTTGLCAGNTRDEAMLQGLMEIFERYATRKLYQFRLTPPEVPTALFEGTEVLKRLRALGLGFSIRDCSLGKNFPVIGLQLTLPDGRRAMRLGAAASPVTALERCLTEVYQGTPEAAERRFHPPDALGEEDERRIYSEYLKTISTSSGAWPDCAFDGAPSYPFEGFGRTGFDGDARALEHFIGVASRWGGRLYARDCSHLGFPALRLYMPGASEAFLGFTMTRRDYVLWMRLRSHRRTALCLPRASGEAINALASAVLAARGALMPIARDPLSWMADRAMPGVGALEGAFFSLLFGAAGRYELAADEMDSYLGTAASHEGPRLRFSALAAFWRALSSGKTASAAADIIADRFGPGLADQCLAGIAEPASLFSPKDWPVCPDCGGCALRKRCVRPEAEALAVRLSR